MIDAKQVDTIENLISEVKKDYKEWGTTTFPWFRGEPANVPTPLLPKLYRSRPGKQPHNENRLLQQFRMKAPSLGLMAIPLRDHTDEWLFLAQHIGLPTRLLDWSEGLFAALYFALKEDEPAVWMLDPVELNRKSSNMPIQDNVFPLTWFSPDKAPATRLDIAELAFHLANRPQGQDMQLNENIEFAQIALNLGNINVRGAWEDDRLGTNLPVEIHPTNIHVRMHTQKSCFTIQGKIKDCLPELVDSRVLKKYIFPTENVTALREDMRIIGVTHTSVFPDLDNLARELSEIF